MDKQRFSFLRRLEGGDSHKLFYDREHDLYALADNSGLLPTDTDDGALYIDKSRKARVVKGFSKEYPITVSIPVMAKDISLYTWCNTGLVGANTLRKLTGLEVEVDEEVAWMLEAARELLEYAEIPEVDPTADPHMELLDADTQRWARKDDAKLQAGN